MNLESQTFFFFCKRDIIIGVSYLRARVGRQLLLVEGVIYHGEIGFS